MSNTVSRSGPSPAPPTSGGGPLRPPSPPPRCWWSAAAPRAPRRRRPRQTAGRAPPRRRGNRPRRRPRPRRLWKAAGRPAPSRSRRPRPPCAATDSADTSRTTAKNAPFFGDTVLTLTVENGAWDLYGKSGSGQPAPIDYDADYEIDGDTVVFHHSDGSNTYRWAGQPTTPSHLPSSSGRCPATAGSGRGVPACALHDRGVHEAGLMGRRPPVQPGKWTRASSDQARLSAATALQVDEPTRRPDRAVRAAGPATQSPRTWLCGILHRMELSIGPIAGSEWPAARALLHRAFVNEPFTVEMYGPAILDRWGGSWSLYSSLRSEDATVVLGAHVGDVLVGVVMGSTVWAMPALSGDCARASARRCSPRHRLAVSPERRRGPWTARRACLGREGCRRTCASCLGIGRRLLEAVAVALEIGEPAELVLECAPDRVNFYAGLGYEVFSTFADPAGPDAYSMRRGIR